MQIGLLRPVWFRFGSPTRLWRCDPVAKIPPVPFCTTTSLPDHRARRRRPPPPASSGTWSAAGTHRRRQSHPASSRRFGAVTDPCPVSGLASQTQGTALRSFLASPFVPVVEFGIKRSSDSPPQRTASRARARLLPAFRFYLVGSERRPPCIAWVCPARPRVRPPRSSS